MFIFDASVENRLYLFGKPDWNCGFDWLQSTPSQCVNDTGPQKHQNLDWNNSTLCKLRSLSEVQTLSLIAINSGLPPSFLYLSWAPCQGDPVQLHSRCGYLKLHSWKKKLKGGGRYPAWLIVMSLLRFSYSHTTGSWLNSYLNIKINKQINI